jgi:hypothetical protein
MKTLVVAATLAALTLGAVAANATTTTCSWWGTRWVCQTW